MRILKCVVMGVPLALLGAQAAMAADYNLIVPVSLSALPPEIRELEVNCSIYSPRPGSTTALESIGSGSVRRPVSGGAFSGDVTVPVNRSALAGTRAATQYNCFLRVYGSISGRPVEFWSYDDPKTGQYGLKSPPDIQPRLEIPARAGAAKVVSVKGPIGR